MTESTFPFEAAAEEAAAPDGGDRKKLLLVGGVGALLVAVLGYTVVLPAFAGADDAVPQATMVRTVTPKKKAPAAKPAAKKPAAQPASYSDVSARTDPFKPLVVAAPPAAPVATAAPGTGSGTVTPPSGTSGTGGTSGTVTGSNATVGGQRVILLHVYTKDGKSYAQTKVGDKVFSPAVGGVFANSYKLLAVSGKSATYLYGDEQFSLSEGQEVLK